MTAIRRPAYTPRNHVRRSHRSNYSRTNHRLNEIRKLLLARHGIGFESDDMSLYLVPVAKCLYRIKRADLQERLRLWCEGCKIKISDADLADCITETMDNPKLEKADELASRLRVTYAEREILSLVTIGAFDVTKRQRKQWRRERKRVKDRLRIQNKRREQGRAPRDQWLAASKTALEPWVAEGVSRATWYRRHARNGLFVPSGTQKTSLKRVSETGVSPCKPYLMGRQTCLTNSDTRCTTLGQPRKNKPETDHPTLSPPFALIILHHDKGAKKTLAPRRNGGEP
jgi:hypothetical protein